MYIQVHSEIASQRYHIDQLPLNLLYKCVVAKLGSKAGNFLSGNREIEGRDRGER